MNNLIFIWLSLCLSIFEEVVNAQRTPIDKYVPQLRTAKEAVINALGRTGENPQNLKMARQLGKLQPILPDDMPFPCPLNNTRSHTPPTTVHALRPGDIDITASLGDSLSAGNGLAATNVFHIVLENRGISFAAGGQENWRKFVTVPNILKEFNPNLIGYTSRDSFTYHKTSEFNVAEAGAMSHDMPYMAKVLINRLKLDKRVNIAEHWKIIHFFIGGNDFCLKLCYHRNPEDVIESHRKDLLEVLRTFKENLPRTFINIILSPNLHQLSNITLSNRPGICYITHNFFCPCLFGLQFAKFQKRFYKIMEIWKNVDAEVSNSQEFDAEDFAVVLQPFVQEFAIPKNSNGLTDYSWLSEDCFHLSQKTGAKVALSIWNNMLEPVGKKSTKPWDLYNFKCPTADAPYIYTRRNSN